MESVARVIALVGIDGSGKTTQAVRLTEALRAAGVPVRYGPNPGGRRWIGRALRRFSVDDPTKVLGRRSVLVVESALRWLAIARSLATARLTGRVAVMDRYAVCQLVSIRVHEGGPAIRRSVEFAYAIFPGPDALIYLDIAPELAYHRIEQRGTDHEELRFLQKSSAAYRDLASDAVPVDAGMTEDEVAQAVWKAVLAQSDVTTR